MAVLNRLGIPVTRLSSSGGFLGRKNTTLLVGVPEGKDPAILQAITSASQQRVEFLPAGTDETQRIHIRVGRWSYNFYIRSRTI